MNPLAAPSSFSLPLSFVPFLPLRRRRRPRHFIIAILHADESHLSLSLPPGAADDAADETKVSLLLTLSQQLTLQHGCEKEGRRGERGPHFRPRRKSRKQRGRLFVLRSLRLFRSDLVTMDGGEGRGDLGFSGWESGSSDAVHCWEFGGREEECCLLPSCRTSPTI